MPTEKVYLVGEGEYSDYSITGVFSTRELAEKYVSENGEGNIEEFTVDEMATRVKLTVYSCWIEYENGQISNDRVYNIMADPHLRANEVKDVGRFTIVTSHVSLEHAHKLAAEARQAWQRKKTETA